MPKKKSRSTGLPSSVSSPPREAQPSQIAVARPRIPTQSVGIQMAAEIPSLRAVVSPDQPDREDCEGSKMRRFNDEWDKEPFNQLHCEQFVEF